MFRTICGGIGLFLTLGTTAPVAAQDVRVKQLSVRSTAFVRQAPPQAFSVRQRRTVVPVPRQGATQEPAPRQSGGSQTTSQMRINDFSQLGRSDRFSIPSVREGVRITQNP
ncbi:hypothetical protein C8N30_3769 [Sulfitobacter guttiformis]|uniref:Uncharacterized protein n=1 Tax=Sulfitobacter guttiformis TaxID=74349 RepID=A0A420DKB4_9RHOB|nr:hypothetical protein C8N30_3769 [Sulfitobacter guttiformis]